MESIVIYGIPSCNSVKKAKEWLETKGVCYQFYDFKKQGVPELELDRWLEILGWETVLNRKGTTWRNLEESLKTKVQDAQTAKQLCLDHSSVIKRPLIDWKNHNSMRYSVGFNPETWIDGLKI